MMHEYQPSEKPDTPILEGETTSDLGPTCPITRCDSLKSFFVLSNPALTPITSVCSSSITRPEDVPTPETFRVLLPSITGNPGEVGREVFGVGAPFEFEFGPPRG